jgi:hypothetical protein
MKTFSTEHPQYLYESLEDKVKEKLTQNFSSLKSGTLELVEGSVQDTSELVNVQNFIADYIREPNSGNLVNFVEDNDIFDFYLKYQVDVDQLCNDNGFLDDTPKSKNIFSLYNVIIEGTKFAVIECMKIIQEEVF